MIQRFALAGIFVLVLALPQSAPDTPTQLHLGLTATPSNSIVVMWRTSADTRTHTVQYGTNGSLSLFASGTSASAPNGASGRIHTVTVSGLQPGTLYDYRCGDAEAGWSAASTFRTAPAGPAACTIGAYGDQGTTEGAPSVEALVEQHKPDLLLVLGDIPYAEGDETIWDSWFNLVQPVAASAPLVPCIGNHEVGSDRISYLARFTLPHNEYWYSVDYGDIHLLSIDCMVDVGPGSEQYAWVAADLAAATRNPAIRWKIAFFHYPAYTSGDDHPVDGEPIRINLTPLFDAYHVDLAFSGHEHSYERTYPILDGAATSGALNSYTDPAGTVYDVTGTGGRPLYGFAANNAWSAVRLKKYGFSLLSFDGAGKMTAKFLATDGTTGDSFSISKSAADAISPTVRIASPADGATVARGPVRIAAKAFDNAGVTSVDFLVDGSLVATDELAPFETTWDGSAAALASHTITVRARDRTGNSSSAASAFTLGESTSASLIAKRSSWRYRDTGEDLGTAWRAASYDDASWPAGPGILGYGEKYIATTVSYGSSASRKYTTTYFRESFSASGSVSDLTLRVAYDDGFVAFLNGVEVARANMPSGAISYSTRASKHIEADTSYPSFPIDGSLLVAGTNVLAVEVHQADAASSDLVFDADLTTSSGWSPPPPPPSAQTLITKRDTWRYRDTGQDLGSSWRVAAYDDSIWASGAGILGYGESYINTTVSYGGDSAHKYVTTYFRKSFSTVEPSSGLTLNVTYDDGFVAYLNGVEVARANMPTGSVSYSTRASNWIDADGSSYASFTIDGSLLVSGTNVLAVEVHQADAASSDIVFDAELVTSTGSPPLPPPSGGQTHITKLDSWRYRDTGQDLGTGWREAAYDDAAWPAGAGILGYGESYIATTVSYGGDAAKKYITTYFRKSFSASGPASSLTLRVAYDDGFVAYLNGVEVARANMPSGSISYSTRASTWIDTDGSSYASFTIDGSLLVSGTNVLAVEVHQADAASSDVVFDAELATP